MAKNLKRLCALVMALVMCGGMFCTTVSAATTLENGNIWNGGDLALNITAGTEGYSFMSIWNDICGAHEMSGHVVGGEIPQTFTLVDTEKYDGQVWTPSPAGEFDPMTSNFDVTYCCDVETMMADGVYYKRLNLEDSEYYTAEQAAKIRVIVTNAYPYVSLEDMKAKLAEEGFVCEGELERGEIISAVQAAVWAVANNQSLEDMQYIKSFWIADNYGYGRPMHDHSPERTLDIRGSRKTKVYADVEARIESLTAYLLNQEATYADKAQIIITKLDLNGDPVKISDTQAQVPLVLELNNSGSGYEDSINVTIKCDGEVVKTFPVELGVEKYTLNIVTGLQTKITAEVSGTQVLPAGVYFYAPKAADVNGDGIVSSREVSQNLVGAAMGATPVYAYDEMDLSIIDIPNLPNNPPAGDVIIPEPPVNKEADGLDEKDQTNVTLTVGGETAAPVDIVIALGAGIAKEANTYDSMVALVEPLIEKDVPVKLGLVAVEHYTDVAMKLTELTADNYKGVIESGLATIKVLPAGPTNLHSNIETAKAMLDADKAVEAQNKYFYVIATGRTYNYDNEYGAPTTIINKLSLNGNTYYYWGHYLWQSQRGQHTSLYRVPTSYNNDFAAYWADVEKWVAADGDKYAYTFPIASYDDPQWFNNYYAVNGTDLKAHGIASSRYGWLITELTNSGTAAIGSGTNPQNALNYERAQYEAYYAYKAMVEAGYNCQALCSESVTYQNYSPYMTVQGVATGIQLGHSFMDHMAKLSGQDEATVLFQLTDDNGNYKMAENFFTAIEPTAGTVTVASGSYVEDFIGKNDNGNFEFIEDASVITLKIGDVGYKTAQIETKEGANSSYSFTAPESAEPTFWLDYYYGNGVDTEKFIWTFGENVTSDKPASLTYKLQLTEKQEAEGEYTVNTNNSATLYPVGGDPKDFPVPEVNYTVEKEPEEVPVPPTVSYKSGDVSNISFMLIDADGNVEFLYKIDADGATSHEIPTEEGKISAVFMKQGNDQGLFWASQELSEELWQKVIDCVDENNPSYKGYTEIASGMGEHSYIFKNGKTITYTFAGGVADVDMKEEVKVDVSETTTETTTPSEPEVKDEVKDDATESTTETTAPSEPVVPEVEETKPEAPKGELKVKVDGGKVKNWTVINGVTGIYIEANGKIPAVIWTSVKVEGAALDAFIAELGADAENEVLFGFGEHKVEYQQNKNKTKTVTFTFTNLAEPEVAVVAETEAATEPVVEETEAATEAATEPVVEETEPEVEETKSNGKDKKNKKNK